MKATNLGLKAQVFFHLLLIESISITVKDKKQKNEKYKI
jgi:hypothetical protein